MAGLCTFLPRTDLSLMFDVSHNTCKVEPHVINGRRHQLFVHRRGQLAPLAPGTKACRLLFVQPASRS